VVVLRRLVLVGVLVLVLVLLVHLARQNVPEEQGNKVRRWSWHQLEIKTTESETAGLLRKRARSDMVA